MSDTKIAIDPQFIHFKLVTTQVEMMHVAAVRGICNLEEVGVPAQHEFDDNDNFATHALGYYHDEPISAVRMRFFGDFVKLERACVRPRYRNRHILPRAIDLVSRFAGQKGTVTLSPMPSPPPPGCGAFSALKSRTRHRLSFRGMRKATSS